MSRFLFWLGGFLKIRFISRDGTPYLERYYIGSILGLTFYLHRFVGEDGDEQLHNHPWKFSVGILLCGMYRELKSRGLALTIPNKICTLEGFRRFNFIFRNTFHQIIYVEKETWTLFIHTNKKESWGFIEEVYQDTPDEPPYLLYTEPFAYGANESWWLSAPSGRNAKREMFKG